MSHMPMMVLFSTESPDFYLPARGVFQQRYVTSLCCRARSVPIHSGDALEMSPKAKGFLPNSSPKPLTCIMLDYGTGMGWKRPLYE